MSIYVEAVELDCGAGDAFAVFNFDAQGIASGMEAVLIYCGIYPWAANTKKIVQVMNCGKGSMNEVVCFNNKLNTLGE